MLPEHTKWTDTSSRIQGFDRITRQVECEFTIEHVSVKVMRIHTTESLEDQISVQMHASGGALSMERWIKARDTIDEALKLIQEMKL